jgi:PAS domain S-box-containing protein
VEYFKNSRQFFFLEFNASGKLVYANPYFKTRTLTITGLSAIDGIGRSIAENSSSPDHSFIIKTIDHYPDGTVLSIRWELMIHRDEDGKIENFQAAGTEQVIKMNGHLDLTDPFEKLKYQTAILENVSDIIISCDMDHKVRSWNKIAEEFYQIRSADAIGRQITDLVQVEYCDCTRAEAHNMLEEHGNWKGEVIYRTADGEAKYICNSLAFLLGNNGQRIGVMVIGKDISQKKKAEQELFNSELFYRNLTSNSLDGILVANKDGKLKFASPSIERILGFTKEEVIGRNAFEFVHPADQAVAWESFQEEVIEAPKVKHIVIRLLRKDGSWTWCMVRGHNLIRNTELSGLVIYFFDDTLRKSAEDALKESEGRFRNLIRNLNMGVIMRDANGKALLCNQTVLDFTCMTEEEFLNTQSISNQVTFTNEDGSEIPTDQHPQIVATRTKKPVRNTVLGAYRKRKKEWGWLIVDAEPILNDKGDVMHVVTTFIDITERKNLEAKLFEEKMNKQKLVTRATIEAQEKERKEIGKELHDNIGQHLTTTKLYLDIARGTADEATLELISLATKSVSDVINELRRLSRSITPPTLGDLGLVESVRDLCEPLKKTQAFAIRFYHRQFDEDSLPENTKLMLFRIIQEQINNIIRHADASTILIRLETSQEKLSLVVSDNGNGFDPTVHKKGFGLTNIVNRAELFDGKVEIQSGEGKGCKVIVTIPLQ